LIPGRFGEQVVEVGLGWIDASFELGRDGSKAFDAFGGFVQRVIRSVFSLILLIPFLLRFVYCALVFPLITHGRSLPGPSASDVSHHSMRTLEIEVVIIDKDGQVKNPITGSELSARIRDADRILRERARIKVQLHGSIQRSISQQLYDIDASGSAQDLSEWLKGPLQLLGRNNPRHLTVYAVGTINGRHDGLHEPLYGSVFVLRGNGPTVMAHELGHALLSIGNMGHRADTTNLMYPNTDRERAVSWPKGSPTLTEDQWCAMRQSRWLKWSWDCDKCVAVGR